MKTTVRAAGARDRWRAAAARARALLGLLARAAARRPLALLLDMAVAIAQGALTGAGVGALGSLVNRRDLSALALWGAALLGGVVATNVRPLLSRRAQQGLRAALGEELLQAAARLPFEDLSRREVRTHLDRAADVLQGDRVYHLLEHGLNLLAECSRLGAVAVLLASLAPGLALPVAAAIGVQVWADAVRVRRRFALDRRTRSRQGFAGYLQGLLADPGVNAEARVFGGARWLIARWRRVWEGLRAGRQGLARREMGRDALVRGSALAAYLGSFVYGVALARQGALSVGGVVALAAGVRALQAATEEISYQLADAQGHALYLLDALAVLDRARAAPAGLRPLCARETITVRQVRYRYPGARREALRGVTLALRRGHLLALVGENGSGKTTLARVLLGLLPPASGRVEGDGGPPLRPAAVLQDFGRYDLSLRENVGLGDPARVGDDAALGRAIASVGDAAVAAARRGLDALLGTGFEGATDLSGGQWQAVATARGVFARGDLVVCDEPTAALDPLAEREAFARFADLARGRFAVIVTHRMGAAALAAEIAVMHRGRVVERGTHADLLAAGGLYARMWEAQAEWYR